MARRIILARPIEGHTELVSKAELGGSPFALLVEYLPARDRRLGAKSYRAKLQLKLRDGAALALIRRHGLQAVVLYSDGQTGPLEKEKEAAEVGALAGIGSWDVAQFLSAVWRWGWLAGRGARAVEITVERLLDVVEIEGATSDEVSFVVHQVRSAIDKLAAKMFGAASFDGDGAVVVYLPGEPMKPSKDKSGTAPSKWGG